MGVLVEDLLTLARLDAVREPARELVDLSQLTATAVDAARIVTPERKITLHADQSLGVTGDPHQLRQVLDNLLRNAIKHTPESTSIDVTIEQTDGHAKVEVRDHGPGLPPGDARELFERFRRAEAGRGRGKGGAGLGLAIVAAIVDVHGGTVTAANAPDGGARFVVSVPASPEAAQPRDSASEESEAGDARPAPDRGGA